MQVGLADDKLRHRRIAALAAIALGCVLLWQTWWGSLLLYPFTILATWFHEMGHGLMALLMGWSFDRLAIYPDGSGVALSLRPADTSRLATALVSAAGPLGPPLAGSMLLLASRNPKATRSALSGLAIALILTTLIWVRSLVGWIVLPAMAIGLLAIVLRGSPKLQDFVIQLLGVQACISTYRSVDYLFSSGGAIDGQIQRSDTAAIADALLLPYWFWGAAISAIILALLAGSMRLALGKRA
ncbi:MAG: M50 family metallopeptidase [Novosphingobium sp.]